MPQKLTVTEWIARAIVGPWNLDAVVDRPKLERLREIRWGHLTKQERGEKLAQAQAALNEANLLYSELRDGPP